MKYAKLNNGQLFFSPKTIIIDGFPINNPKPAQLIEAGFKEFIDIELPPKKHYHTIPTFSETETEVIRIYQYVKAEQPDYDELVSLKVSEQYSVSKEFARTNLGMQNQEDPKYIEYRDYVDSCKAWAQEQINEYLEA